MSKIKYRAHCANFGWQAPVEDGQIAGTVGENRALECYRIEELNIPGEPDMNVHAFAHVQDLGWSAGNTKGEDVGSTGLGKHIEAIKIGLIGKNANQYDIWYRLHVQNRGFLNWSKNGEVNGTIGGNVQAEAIQIEVHKKSENWYPFVDKPTSFMDLTPVAPPPAPTENEESKRARIVAIAQSYVGYVGDGYSIFGERHGDPYGDYCAYFDWSVYEDAGLADLIPHTGYCPYAKDWFLKHATASFYWRGDYIPKNGDLIYFDWDDNGVPNHTGIVEGCDGSTVCTIEGNTGTPAQVMRKYWDINDPNILGYGVPDFSQA